MATREDDPQLAVFFRWATFFALQGTGSASAARRAAFATTQGEIERGIPGSRRRQTTLARRAARRGGTSHIAARYYVLGDTDLWAAVRPVLAALPRILGAPRGADLRRAPRSRRRDSVGGPAVVRRF